MQIGPREEFSRSPEDLSLQDTSLFNYLQTSLKSTSQKELLIQPLEQLYQVEHRSVRGGLVSTLGQINAKEATRALARRAVFDLSPLVRGAAVEQLRKRSLDDARPVFLAAMRHPWSAAADHAALALVALEDDEAVPHLRDLLDEPDPAAPYRDRAGKWVQKELVRVNHLRNCLLCHAPLVDNGVNDVAVGPIPTPGQPLPEVYYGHVRGSALPFVRADIVYFRQDFSAMHKVDKPGRWPAVQRFDYLVRTRQLKPEEAARTTRKAQTACPQREAVEYALSKLNTVDTR
jgi:hypothetical protein